MKHVQCHVNVQHEIMRSDSSKSCGQYVNFFKLRSIDLRKISVNSCERMNIFIVLLENLHVRFIYDW